MRCTTSPTPFSNYDKRTGANRTQASVVTKRSGSWKFGTCAPCPFPIKIAVSDPPLFSCATAVAAQRKASNHRIPGDLLTCKSTKSLAQKSGCEQTSTTTVARASCAMDPAEAATRIQSVARGAAVRTKMSAKDAVPEPPSYVMLVMLVFALPCLCIMVTGHLTLRVFSLLKVPIVVCLGPIHQWVPMAFTRTQG